MWVSRSQTKTDLSTTEAEIISMAHCFRELFPITNIAVSLGKAVGLKIGDTTINVSVHKENVRGLVLARTFPP